MMKWLLPLLPVAIGLAGVPPSHAQTRAQTAEPEGAGIAAAAEKAGDFLEASLEKTGVPGAAMAVVHRGEVVFIRGYGVRKAGEEGRVDADTVFQIASVSKPMAATVLAMLVSEGKVAWDDPVQKLDPAFQLSDPWVSERVTLRDLLSHRSGLPEHAGDLAEDLGFNREEVIAGLRHYPLGNRFRAAYAYTNFAYTEAAVAAAKAMGIDWETLIEERLFKPLEMKRSSPRFRDYEREENRAFGHVPDPEGANGKERWVARYVRKPDAQSPAGGVSSTVRDMTRWMMLELNSGPDGALVIPEVLMETKKPHSVTGFDAETGRFNSYGLGWVISHDASGQLLWSHSGAFSLGSRSAVSLMPGEGVGIVVLANAFPSGLPEAVCAAFYDFLLRGEVREDWLAKFDGLFREMAQDSPEEMKWRTLPENPTKARPLEAYAGEYESPLYGRLSIAVREGKLVATLGPHGSKSRTFTFEHYSGDTFRFELRGEMLNGPGGAEFSFEKETPVSVTLPSLEDGGDLSRFEKLP